MITSKHRRSLKLKDFNCATCRVLLNMECLSESELLEVLLVYIYIYVLFCRKPRFGAHVARTFTLQLTVCGNVRLKDSEYDFVKC